MVDKELREPDGYLPAGSIKICEYRGIEIYQTVQRRFIIKGSFLMLISVDAAKTVIDTYLKRLKEYENDKKSLR